MSITFQQEKRIIDGVPWGAGDFRNDFIENVRDKFTEEELRKWNIEVDYFNHVPQHIVQALETNKNQTIDWDTVTIEITIEDQLFALLYERRTNYNHAELAYLINTALLDSFRNSGSKDTFSFHNNWLQFDYKVEPDFNTSEINRDHLIKEVYNGLRINNEESNYGIVHEKHLYHVRSGKQNYDRHTIELTISDYLVALLYERKQDNQEETIQLINHTMLKQQNTNELANQYKYDRLRYGFRLVHTIDDEDFEEIKRIINQNDLSDYMIDQKDFLAIKNDNDQIVAFGRLFAIGEWQKELSSLWVDPEERWSKIGLYLCKQLIDEKKWDAELYLMTRIELSKYYQKLWFSPTQDKLPAKWKQNKRICASRWVEMIVMEY